MVWESEFKLEKEHRPCLCGICHKQIGIKTPRITLTVESEYGRRIYNKFYHIGCLLKALKKALKRLGDTEINQRMDLLVDTNKVLEKLVKKWYFC